MRNAYRVLGIDASAGDEAVKKAYLERVREFPPDHDPERFQEARSAYEALRTGSDRLRYALFATPEPDLDAIFGPLLAAGKRGRPSVDDFRELFAAALAEFRLRPEGSGRG